MKFYDPIDEIHAKLIDAQSVGPDYIHWFSKPGSVNLWHCMTLYLYTTGAPNLHFSDDSPFWFLDRAAAKYVLDENGVLPENYDDTYLDKDEYVTLANSEGEVDRYVLTKHLSFDFRSTLYPIYIVAHAEEPGEFIDKLESVNGDYINIGIEVEDEDEHLRINLQNMGVEFSNDVSKAIYRTDYDEERPDWATLNTKWRELLANYMDIIGCKGNYKSLLNSLEWFDYGKLVELREVWKHETPGGIKMADRGIHQTLNDWYQQSLSGIAKTTYMVLRQCSIDLSQQIGTALPHDEVFYSGVQEAGGDLEAFKVPVYAPYIYDPERLTEDGLDEMSVKWAKDEMRVKMALLGYYFETNFMPIHLDLLRSSVEDIIFDSPYLVQQAGAAEIEFNDDSSNQMFIVHTLGDDKEPDEPDYDIVIHLDQQHVAGYTHNSRFEYHINFGISSDPTPSFQESILGVTKDLEHVTAGGEGDNNLSTKLRLAQSYFNSIGAVAEFELITPEPVDSGKLITNIAGEQIFRTDNLYCYQHDYIVNERGDIVDFENAPNSHALIWANRAQYHYYKQTAHNLYAIVNAEGLPVSNERYDTPPDGAILWTENITYNPNNTYYIQTAWNIFVWCNELGQQISDEELTTRPTGEYDVEWSMDLTYKRSMYVTRVNLLCTQPGEFFAIIELSNSTTNYARKLNIKVVDNLDVELVFFKLVYTDNFRTKTYNMTLPDVDENGNIIYDDEGFPVTHEEQVTMRVIGNNPHTPGNSRKSGMEIAKQLGHHDNTPEESWTEPMLIRNMFETTREGLIDNYPDIGQIYDNMSAAGEAIPHGMDSIGYSDSLLYPISKKYSELHRHSQYINLPCLGYETWVSGPNAGQETDFPRSTQMYMIYSEDGSKPVDFLVQQINAMKDYFIGKFGTARVDDNKGTSIMKVIRNNGDKFTTYSLRRIDGNFGANFDNTGVSRVIKKVFIPEWHKLVKVEPGEEVSADYPIACCPMIIVGPEKNKKFYWSYPLSNPAWKFYSHREARELTSTFNAQQIFLANEYAEEVPLGTYEITFTWKWGDSERHVTARSPFIITPAVHDTYIH